METRGGAAGEGGGVGRYGTARRLPTPVRDGNNGQVKGEGRAGAGAAFIGLSYAARILQGRIPDTDTRTIRPRYVSTEYPIFIFDL